MGIDMPFGLATLPFQPRQAHPQKTQGRTQNGELIFATWAKVPTGTADRLALLGWLPGPVRRHPYLRVVVRVRATRGEHQTHAERHDYANLMDELQPRAPRNLSVGTPVRWGWSLVRFTRSRRSRARTRRYVCPDSAVDSSVSMSSS